jgi:ribosomal protein L11 methyltransferase
MNQPPAEWLEVCVMVDPETAEAVSEVLSRYVPNGVAIEQIARDLDGADEGITTQLEPIVAVRAYLPVDAELEEKRQKIQEGLWHLSHITPLPEPAFRSVTESDWAEAWKEHYHVLHLGRRFVIKPSWRDYAAQPDEIVIELDPGMAFGTGLHPTTQMCLTALENYLDSRTRVLDLGTGSGILAIGAAKLGARSITAIDIDPLAVKAAAENVQANSVDQLIEVKAGSLPAAVSQAPYDLIIVNILARVIIQLCEAGLGRVVRSGGRAIFAGLIDTQEQGVREALQMQGLSVVDRYQAKDWVCLIARRD